MQKYRTVGRTYTVGDEIPLKGESYSYPENLDIIVLRDDVAVKVRGSRITDILPIASYTYGGVHVVNGRGFEADIHSEEDLRDFLAEYRNSVNDRQRFFDKWLKFDTYRSVGFGR